MFDDDLDAHAAITDAMNELDPAGRLARGAPPDIYEPVIRELAERVDDGEMLYPDLVAAACFRHGFDLDIEDIRELSRRIAHKLGFG